MHLSLINENKCELQEETHQTYHEFMRESILILNMLEVQVMKTEINRACFKTIHSPAQNTLIKPVATIRAI